MDCDLKFPVKDLRAWIDNIHNIVSVMRGFFAILPICVMNCTNSRVLGALHLSKLESRG